MTAALAPSAPPSPGLAGRTIAELGERARLSDVYGPDGADVYHDLSAGDTGEVRELVRLVRNRPGPVLDLAAGSGRITLPLLALGRRVTALDLSQDMLLLLTDRLAQAPARLRERCSVVHGDMAGFRLGTEFTSVVLGTTSVSLLAPGSRTGLYRSVAEHLAPGGRLLVSCLDRGEGPDEAVTEATGASGTRYRVHDHWPVGADHRTVTILPAELPQGPVQVCTGRVGVVGAERLTTELTSAGFTVLERHLLTEPGQRHRVTLIEAETTR